MWWQMRYNSYLRWGHTKVCNGDTSERQRKVWHCKARRWAVVRRSELTLNLYYFLLIIAISERCTHCDFRQTTQAAHVHLGVYRLWVQGIRIVVFRLKWFCECLDILKASWLKKLQGKVYLTWGAGRLEVMKRKLPGKVSRKSVPDMRYRSLGNPKIKLTGKFPKKCVQARRWRTWLEWWPAIFNSW